ncbi:MAG: proline dehydrogenase family protein [Candidatus Omnitrophota bacterium]|nr:proline dehydrogenase family protein [Candidatus Omnitrophota bacterium]
MCKPLDERAVEARTQVIGRELFAAAKREHAHLSVLNRWTAQVLSWCLADPALKSRVLQFLDVLPSLRSPGEIARHVADYFPTTDLRLPAALRLGSQLARPGLLTQRALSTIVTQLVEQVGRQFIAEASTDGARQVIRSLALRGSTCSLDVLGEQVLSEVEADRYVAQCARLLRDGVAADASLPPGAPPVVCGPRVNLSVKPSALSPRFDPISPGPSVERAAQRVLPLLELAAEQGADLTLDMEQFELCDLTIALAKRLLVHPTGHPQARLGIVVQAYLRDAEARTEELLEWLASHERMLSVRLVKGAYWDAEVAQARQAHREIPVHQEKTTTDLSFERLTRRLLSASPLVTTAIASHNIRSIAHAMAVAEALGLAKHQLEFQLLYGMGEAIRAATVARGYPVRIYTPIGQLIPGMAYLVRRLLENSSNDSFLRQDFLQERSADQLLTPPTPRRPSSATTPAATHDPWQREPLLDFSTSHARDRMAQALASVKTQFGQSYPLWIGAEAVERPDPLVARNPAAPRQTIGFVSAATLSDVQRAVELANQAQPGWAALPVSKRVACLRNAAQLMRERRDELAAWTVFEVGKPWREADAEIVEAIDYLEYYSHGMGELADGKTLLQLPGERNAYRYRPRGVAVVIAPWNFPAAIFLGMASAALVSGNTVILKPAKQSSVIAAHLAQILRASGLPPAVAQFLPGSGEQIGAALVQHPGTHVVLFTGSKAVGLSIVEACGKVAPGARCIKHVVAEMGGKNALIIDADADLDAAVHGTLHSAFGYAGQKCSAASRVIVHEAVYDPFLARLIAATDRLVVNDPSDPGTDLGPLIDETAHRRLLAAIARAQEVATVAYRYPPARLPPSGFFIGPTLITEVPRHDALAREELFGPLLCVFRASSFADAMELANDTDYALTGGLYSRSPSHIERAMQAFDVGNLYINRPITGAMVGRQPFGGHRLSGLGTKAGGPDYLLQLLLPKTISTNTARHGIPLDEEGLSVTYSETARPRGPGSRPRDQG